jgi:glyoxylase-like metal-dependent hydrolase (beta-lactamase superfamily II)
MKIPRIGFRKICEDVFLVGSSMRSHPYDCAVYAVSGPKGAVLIDCGCPAGLDRIVQNMRDAGIEPESVELVIGTHCHYDHVGAAAEFKRRFPSARLAMHGADASAVESGDGEATCAEWLFGESAEPASVDFQLQGGDEVFAGGLRFEVLHTPGHSPGSITIVLETGGCKIAFTGDSYIPSCPRVGYDFDAICETWLRLLDLGADFVCPGHDNHSTFDPVVLAMSGVIPASVLRSAIGFRDLAKPVAAASSFYYEHLGVMLKPFQDTIKLFNR